MYRSDYQKVPAGLRYATILPDMDFETYSEAGYQWTGKKWGPLRGATKTGISAVGSAIYTEHPTFEVLLLAYNLKDGFGERLWFPGMPYPEDLFRHIILDGLIEAFNCLFEFRAWHNYCHKKLGWPPLNLFQLRDAQAKSMANAWPRDLENAALVSGAESLKDPDGGRLIKIFSIPQKPTKANGNKLRVHPADRPEEFLKFGNYCVKDIRAEAALSARCPDLSPEELELWQYTLLSNVRGMALDMETIRAAIKILNDALEHYNSELEHITGGAISKASETQKITTWLRGQGIHTDSIDSDHLEKILKRKDLSPLVRRVLEIRQRVGSAGVKKLYAMERMSGADGRAHDLTVYHAARTGRDAGQDIQTQNLVKDGPELYFCAWCSKPYGRHVSYCPYCGCPSDTARKAKWGFEAVEYTIPVIRTGSLYEVERIYGDAVLTLCGCLRSMFVAGEGKELICSDYSSIEAVVTAVLSGEQWRIEAFRRKEDIYLHSASRTTGIPFEDYIRYQKENGTKHPDRSKIGKPQELALGFGGWYNAWLQFDDSGTFTEEEIKKNIIAWREASPMIPELWGGQVRGKPWDPIKFEYYGLEGAAIQAVQNPGQVYEYNGIKYAVHGDILYCRLLSGRFLTYHRPRLSPSLKWPGQLALSFEGWNSNPLAGPVGWVRMFTYGGKLTENVVQATARDIMMYSIPRLERAGYAVVLRVHDEIVTEVLIGFGSVEEVEAIMGTLPTWAKGWPIRAAGGWRGKRYRKE